MYKKISITYNISGQYIRHIFGGYHQNNIPSFDKEQYDLIMKFYDIYHKKYKKIIKKNYIKIICKDDIFSKIIYIGPADIIDNIHIKLNKKYTTKEN